MTKIQQNLDRVISNVQKKLFDSKNVIPKKTDEGIVVGNALIVSRGCLKDIYYKGELVYPNISLNKVAVRVANLLATGYRQTPEINELIDTDLKFGQALEDYQFFKNKYNNARTLGDQFKIDLYLARMCYSKDAAAYHKTRATSLAAK
jgi:hypothetical protein